jgi:cobalamin biosynthesis Mg chelatase CobN
MSFIRRWLGIVKSVLASFLGVQTHAQYTKDAKMSSFVPFLIVGIVMVIALISVIWILVNVMLQSH